MTNVYTRKNHHPRTITLLDYRIYDNIYAPQRRMLSPTRCGNPHPQGLNHQSIPKKSNFLIWRPDFSRKAEKYSEMVNHTRLVNFSCSQPDKYDFTDTRVKLPDIRYTENTVSRSSYIDPSRYKNLAQSLKTQTAVCHPDKKAVTGIVPNLYVPTYLPVIEK